MELTKAKGLLFDLDGTLLDTAKDLGNTLNYLLEQHGLPQKTEAEFRPYASHGARGLLQLGFGQNTDLDALRGAFLQHYQDNICVGTDTFSGIETLLDGLRARGIPWGIVTNKPEFLTQPLLTHFPQFHDCGVVVCGDTLPQAKPHPAPMLMAADKLGIPAQDIWYVGDAERDIQAANASDMVSVLAEYGYIGETDDTLSWKADFTINTPTALLDLLA